MKLIRHFITGGDFPQLPASVRVGLYSDETPSADFGRDTENGFGHFIFEDLLQDSEFSACQTAYKKYATGKPYLDIDGRILAISLSHTQHVYLAGFNRDGEIGVDIESVHRNVNDRLGSRIHNSADEIDENLAVIQLWTIKEAVLKLTGSGLRTNMNKIPVRQISPVFFTVNHENYDISIVSLRHSDFWISTAYTQNN